MPPALDLELIKPFLTVVETKGFQATAEQLHKTPAAISQQIKILETQLKIPLIMKDGRRASLAPAARSYHDLLSAGFAKLQQAQGLLAERMADRDGGLAARRRRLVGLRPSGQS